MSAYNPQRDRVQAIQKRKSFRDLKSIIDSGALNFRYILASHGTGSTSVALKLGQEGDFDVVINEPDCAHFVNDDLGCRYKIENVYDYLLDAYKEAQAQRPDKKGAIRMLVKFMPSSWPYYFEYDSLLELNDQPLFLTRYPSFSLESRLRQICRLLSDEYDEDFGYSPKVKKLFNACVAGRDFAKCPADILNTHRSFYEKTPQMKAVANKVNALWANEAKGLGEAHLPEDTLFNYFSHFTANYTIRARWSDIQKRPFNEVLDFESFQYDPQFYAQKIVKSLWGLDPLKVKGNDASFKNAYDHFYPKDKGKIFTDITFGNSLKLDGEILPPTRLPLPMTHFPTQLHAPLQGLIDLYIDQMKTSDLHFPVISSAEKRDMQEKGISLNPVFMFNAYKISAAQEVALGPVRPDYSVWPEQFRAHFTPCYKASLMAKKDIPRDMFPQ
tara:strand:+ start:95656 stop:96981 length:1326 start_codon:yes stop_codon:yes gene_type:complete